MDGVFDSSIQWLGIVSIPIASLWDGLLYFPVSLAMDPDRKYFVTLSAPWRSEQLICWRYEWLTGRKAIYLEQMHRLSRWWKQLVRYWIAGKPWRGSQTCNILIATQSLSKTHSAVIISWAYPGRQGEREMGDGGYHYMSIPDCACVCLHWGYIYQPCVRQCAWSCSLLHLLTGRRIIQIISKLQVKPTWNVGQNNGCSEEQILSRKAF